MASPIPDDQLNMTNGQLLASLNDPYLDSQYVNLVKNSTQQYHPQYVVIHNQEYPLNYKGQLDLPDSQQVSASTQSAVHAIDVLTHSSGAMATPETTAASTSNTSNNLMPGSLTNNTSLSNKSNLDSSSNSSSNSANSNNSKSPIITSSEASIINLRLGNDQNSLINAVYNAAYNSAFNSALASALGPSHNNSLATVSTNILASLFNSGSNINSLSSNPTVNSSVASSTNSSVSTSAKASSAEIQPRMATDTTQSSHQQRTKLTGKQVPLYLNQLTVTRGKDKNGKPTYHFKMNAKTRGDIDDGKFGGRNVTKAGSHEQSISRATVDKIMKANGIPAFTDDQLNQAIASKQPLVNAKDAITFNADVKSSAAKDADYVSTKSIQPSNIPFDLNAAKSVESKHAALIKQRKAKKSAAKHKKHSTKAKKKSKNAENTMQF